MRILLLTALVGLACTAQSATPVVDRAKPVAAHFVEIKTATENLRFVVELARTNAERQRGLMFRTTMADDAGMIFLFDRMAPHSFWMKNTKIPLDMLFIDDQHRIVGIVENAEPMTTTGRSVPGRSKYVLELNGGTTRRLGILPGQYVDFIGFEDNK